MSKHDLTDEDEVAIIATDGVWEFMTNQEVVDVCTNENDPLAACNKIVARSYKTWYEQESRIDDITIVVLFLSKRA